MMQRWCTKLRSLALQSTRCSSASSSRRLLHASARVPPPSAIFALRRTPNFCNAPLLNSALHAHYSPLCFRWLPHKFSAQVRHVSSRDRRKKRKPMTPMVSKVKKTKMKFYSSYKSRFRPMNDGNIRRWKEGKRHNAHLKAILLSLEFVWNIVDTVVPCKGHLIADYFQ
ncbi:uncharacterized protein LOC115731231 isoform X3 [Rhodamnia argentea]|uniref:Uncharacterized protein LOC115731231 isoform X3 n=1 Tax=Rhodamnia argentea TaxID=178133 RepID=A0ABM3HYV4_9MYRT|nr:uncharacterized protein LOC115731231 isoform X3 [Rhodamnia argentea]